MFRRRKGAAVRSQEVMRVGRQRFRVEEGVGCRSGRSCLVFGRAMTPPACIIEWRPEHGSPPTHPFWKRRRRHPIQSRGLLPAFSPAARPLSYQAPIFSLPCSSSPPDFPCFIHNVLLNDHPTATCRDWATKHRRGRTSPIPALVNRAASHVCSNLSSYRRGSTVRRVSSNPMISGIQYDPEWCPLVRG